MSSPSYVVAVISPERRIREGIASALEGYPSAEALWVSGYPDAAQMDAIKGTSGCIVLLDFCDRPRANAIAAELDRDYPMAVSVALQADGGPQQLLDLMQLGIREVVTLPISAPEVVRAVTRASKRLQKHEAPATGGNIYSFMPAKPGAGATTMATHVSAAAARLANQRMLLADFDLRLGMTSFLFKLHNERSILDALKSAETLDTSQWNGLVSTRGMLDILGSAPAEFGFEIPEGGSGKVLDFAAQLYSTLLVDLPGDMRAHELEIMLRSKEIFLVCTPDIGTLHVAKKKADMLRSLDLAASVSVIMNRSGGRGSMPTADIEELLRLQVRFTVGSADREFQEATQRASLISGPSPIATQLENIARHIVPGIAPVDGAPGKRRFIDFFSITPVREKASWKR